MPPIINIDFHALPTDQGKRRQALADCFGEHLFWIRDFILDVLTNRVIQEKGRMSLPTIERTLYEEMASLDKNTQQTAVGFAAQAVNAYIHYMLTLFANMGTDLKLGADHAVRYKILIEVLDLAADDQIVLEEPINRDTGKHFVDFFKSWMRCYGKYDVQRVLSPNPKQNPTSDEGRDDGLAP